MTSAEYEALQARVREWLEGRVWLKCALCGDVLELDGSTEAIVSGESEEDFLVECLPCGYEETRVEGVRFCR